MPAGPFRVGIGYPAGNHNAFCCGVAPVSWPGVEAVSTPYDAAV